MRRIDVARAHSDANAVNGRDAVHGRCRCAKRNERVHVGGTMHEAFETAAEILEVHRDNGNEQQELRECERDHVLVAQEARGKRPAEHMAHGKIEQRNGEHERHDQATAHGRLGFSRLLVRGLSRGLCRGNAALCDRLRALAHRDARLSAVARLVNGSANGCIHFGHRIRRFVGIGNLHAVFQQVHGDFGHAINRCRGFLDARLACRACHSRYIERLLHICSQPARPRGHLAFQNPPTLSHGRKATPLGQAEPSRQSAPRGRA